MYSDVRSCNEGIKALQYDDYEMAVSKFTAGLSVSSDPIDRSILLSNRSSAFVALDQYDDAISDAKECVKLRPKWAKGYICWGKSLEAKEDFRELCTVYVNAIKRGDGLEEFLLKPLIIANGKYNIFSKDFMDVLLLGNAKYCEICQKNGELLRCSRCRILYYCSKDHQKEHWRRHKNQCSILSDAHNYLLEEKSLVISKDLPWVILKKGFLSLVSVTDWDRVWKHLECVACTSDVFYGRMSESMSWSLTLIKSICKFNLTNKEKLVVHILGADDSYNKEGYYTYFSGFFPFPNTELILVGPDLLHNTLPLEFKSAGGSKISISYVADVWHNYTQQPYYKQPDIVFASHPGIHEEYYDWDPTLNLLLANDIPVVFTTWHKEDFLETKLILKGGKYDADVIFDGPAPFPSLIRRYARKRWNEYGIQTMNSYWVGFKGKAN